MYDVDKEDICKDIENVSRAIEEFYNTPIEKRLENSNKARKALDQFRPEKIGQDWKNLFGKPKNKKKGIRNMLKNYLPGFISYYL